MEELKLQIREQKTGVLVTNALEIRKFIEQKLKEYTPERFEGKIDEAKKARAELNRAAKDLNDRRIDLEKVFMEPFYEFKDIIKYTTDAIYKASGALGEIVKIEEDREKEEKRVEVQALWETMGFDVIPLEKIFNPRWLNKTMKHTEILGEMTAQVSQIKKDLVTLSQMKDGAALRPAYLESLDLAEVLRQAEDLREAEERLKLYEERQGTAPEPTQTASAPPAPPEPQVEQAEEVDTYTLVVTGKRSALFRLREFMDSNDITFRKVG